MGVSAKIKIGALAAALALGGLSALVIVSRGSDEPESRVSLAPTSEVSKKHHLRRSSRDRARRERNAARGGSPSGSAGEDASPEVVVAPHTQPAIVPAPDQANAPDGPSVAPDESEAAPAPETEQEREPESEPEAGDG